MGAIVRERLPAGEVGMVYMDSSLGEISTVIFLMRLENVVETEEIQVYFQGNIKPHKTCEFQKIRWI